MSRQRTVNMNNMKIVPLEHVIFPLQTTYNEVCNDCEPCRVFQHHIATRVSEACGPVAVGFPTNSNGVLPERVVVAWFIRDAHGAWRTPSHLPIAIGFN